MHIQPRRLPDEKVVCIFTIIQPCSLFGETVIYIFRSAACLVKQYYTYSALWTAWWNSIMHIQPCSLLGETVLYIFSLAACLMKQYYTYSALQPSWGNSIIHILPCSLLGKTVCIIHIQPLSLLGKTVLNIFSPAACLKKQYYTYSALKPAWWNSMYYS